MKLPERNPLHKHSLFSEIDSLSSHALAIPGTFRSGRRFATLFLKPVQESHSPIPSARAQDRRPPSQPHSTPHPTTKKVS